MSVQKRDINLFKAAGGERAKSKKRPITTYLIATLLIVIVGVIGAIVYFNYALSGLRDDYAVQQNIGNNYDITVDAIKNLDSEYQVVVSEIYAANKIEQYLAIRSNRYTKPTENELAGIQNSITSFNYTTDVDLINNGEEFLNNLNKADVNYDTLYGALSYLINQQMSSRRTPLWYTYFRGQLVVVFAGGQATGVNLEELATSLYNGVVFEEIGYEPLMDLRLGGQKYVDAKYMAASIGGSELVYNIMLLTTKTVEERAIDTLEESSSRLWGESAGLESDFEYELTKIEYNNSEGTLTVEINFVESADFTIKNICDDLEANVFFNVSKKVVSPPANGQKTVPIILDIEGAYLIAE
jgi:hypothetical protein